MLGYLDLGHGGQWPGKRLRNRRRRRLWNSLSWRRHDGFGLLRPLKSLAHLSAAQQVLGDGVSGALVQSIGRPNDGRVIVTCGHGLLSGGRRAWVIKLLQHRRRHDRRRRWGWNHDYGGRRLPRARALRLGQ